LSDPFRSLEPLTREPGRAAVLLDFDGTLSDIVARPELARPVEGARDAVAGLVGVFGLVAVVSGRRGEDVEALLGVEGVRYAGQYGLEASAGTIPVSVPAEVRSVAEAAAEQVPGAWAEHKESGVAVHFRQAPDPGAARALLAHALEPAARAAGLEVIEGKMVLEIVPAGLPRKGGAVERLLRDHGAAAAMYAGDDLADLEAFEALDRLRAGGLRAVKVAVRGAEEWPALLGAADLVVEGPAALVELLRRLRKAALRSAAG
jgi:trehalose 6-phosphate phosphatase